jgi:hypothetical protein
VQNQQGPDAYTSGPCFIADIEYYPNNNSRAIAHE